MNSERPAAPICSIQRTAIQILKATYGPAEGRRLLDGTLVDYTNRNSFVPYSRDVIPFLAALASNECTLERDFTDGPCFDIGNKNSIALMDGRSMNSVFGDPCPGTTKLLQVEYLFRDYFWSETVSDTSVGFKKKKLVWSTSRVYTSTFAEHDRVYLKRQDALFRVLADLLTEQDEKQPSKVDCHPESTPDIISNSTNRSSQMHLQTTKSNLTTPLSPTYNTSEITMKLVLPYLTVRERAKCQLVCSSWKHIVLDTGIAVTIDVNDTTLFPRDSSSLNTRPNIASLSPFVPQSPAVPDEQSEQSNNSSRAILRGLLIHSHSSLESLVLNDYLPLRPLTDLHPSLPHLRKLKRLDISRVPSINDETLQLISTFIGARLEVMYMKGLRHVSNEGVVHLVQSCPNLRVLDVSYLHQLEDEAGIAIGRHLTKLEVFHARDLYRWTNKSVDLITTNCKKLVQATFWGCIRLNHVSFSDMNSTAHIDDLRQADTNFNTLLMDPVLNTFQSNTLILLNLWGCHSLQNSTASLLSPLTNLRSLCVSECHKLTDDFVIVIAQSFRQLLHLQLRYLRRITDASIEAISSMLPSLYSLDVSFCTKLSINAIAKLLQERSDSLAELRLYSCRQLNLEGGNTGAVMPNGRRLTQALGSVRESSILSILDLRKCDEESSLVRDGAFLRDMSNLCFFEELQGFFRRPAAWSDRVIHQLSESCDGW